MTDLDTDNPDEFMTALNTDEPDDSITTLAADTLTSPDSPEIKCNSKSDPPCKADGQTDYMDFGADIDQGMDKEADQLTAEDKSADDAVDDFDLDDHRHDGDEVYC